jgi:hypothetical protein
LEAIIATTIERISDAITKRALTDRECGLFDALLERIDGESRPADGGVQELRQEVDLLKGDIERLRRAVFSKGISA